MSIRVSVFLAKISALDGDPSDLDIGDEVEFTLSRKTSKVSAETIRKVPRGTVVQEVGVFENIVSGFDILKKKMKLI